MAIYEYRCTKHGNIEIQQSMTEVHEANCPICFIKMERVFNSAGIKIGKGSPIGKNREELFNNLALEGNGSKDWKEHDPVWKQAHGILD